MYGNNTEERCEYPVLDPKEALEDALIIWDWLSQEENAEKQKHEAIAALSKAGLVDPYGYMYECPLCSAHREWDCHVSTHPQDCYECPCMYMDKIYDQQSEHFACYLTEFFDWDNYSGDRHANAKAFYEKLKKHYEVTYA
jgi:hypothetical protein